jgi:DNA-directed RNA polymerase specialized sigma24 family protein
MDPISGLDAHLDQMNALATLSRKLRAPLMLTDLLGFSSDDAGRMLHIGPSTVRVHAARARVARNVVIDHD